MKKGGRRLKGEKKKEKRGQEKQNILEDRAKLFANKRKVKFERDQLRERVEELEGELGDLKENFLVTDLNKISFYNSFSF